MAFPIPEHLPRKVISQDVSTNVLSKISETTHKSLTASLAASWINELETNIQQTKDKIHERISTNALNFDRQLQSAQSVQTRLWDLSSNVDKLSDSFSASESGLLPTLLRSLNTHASLVQQASDATMIHETLSYFSRCAIEFSRLMTLSQTGKLAEVVSTASDLQTLMNDAPSAFTEAEIMKDFKHQLCIMKARVEEQLSEVFSRSIRISSTGLHIFPVVKVQHSQITISLPEILSSITTDSLDLHLVPLRRDLINHFINYPLQQPVLSSISSQKSEDGTSSYVFSLSPLHSQVNSYESTISYLQGLFDFLDSHLFSALPSTARISFAQSLRQPTIDAILHETLIASIPSSLTNLSPYFSLAHKAVQFERNYLKLGGEGQSEREIKEWVEHIPIHYGKRRRVDLLDSARKLLLSVNAQGYEKRMLRIEVPQEFSSYPVPSVIPVQDDIENSENGWDFDERIDADTVNESETSNRRPEECSPSKVEEGTSVKDEEQNGWDFDEDVTDDLAEKEDNEKVYPEPSVVSKPIQHPAVDAEEDPSDAWGWGDDTEDENALVSEDSQPRSEDNAPVSGVHSAGDELAESGWDDPWDDAGPEPELPSSEPSITNPISPAKPMKVAKRLEKLSAKGKHLSSSSSTPVTPVVPSPPLHSNAPSPLILTNKSPRYDANFIVHSSLSSGSTNPSSSILENAMPITPKTDSLPPKQKEKETYVISGQAQDVVSLIKNVISEGHDTARSNVFSDFAVNSDLEFSSTPSPSFLIYQTASFVLDLYRAIYPIAVSDLALPSRAMEFSNDCLYISEEVLKLKLPHDFVPTLTDQLQESAEKLKVLGERWRDKNIERQGESILDILSRAAGFEDTGDQDRFDECESVMSDVLRTIRSVANQWKTILPQTQFYQAIGQVVETTLTRILDNILALPDIPELDSHRLSELCRILNALEGLFVVSPDSLSSVVTYVPSWLKYSYLSELLEASIADISYLFDENALIDFKVEELVNLVRALFADTPLRTKTIAKLQRGHPSPIS